MECIGMDCTYPEAVVAIDSIVNERIYTTLVNSDGAPFTAELSLSSEINVEDFYRYVDFTGEIAIDSRTDGESVLKVYYISENQSYVENNAEFINANSTKFEIVAFGDDLHLTY